MKKKTLGQHFFLSYACYLIFWEISSDVFLKTFCFGYFLVIQVFCGCYILLIMTKNWDNCNTIFFNKNIYTQSSAISTLNLINLLSINFLALTSTWLNILVTQINYYLLMTKTKTEVSVSTFNENYFLWLSFRHNRKIT